jgi:Ser/Thr protein kinase RdoA (MazF antagonist)
MSTQIDAPPLITRSTTTDDDAALRGTQVSRERLLSQLLPTLEALLAARGGFGVVLPMGLPRKSADTSDKYLVRDSLGRPAAVLSLSPAERPHATDVATSSTRMAQAALGPRLGRVVLMPWRTGKINGIGFSVAPYHHPVSTFAPKRALERRRLLHLARGWLQETLRHTVRVADEREIESEFRAPLSALAGVQGLRPDIRQRAAAELRALDAGHWQPRLALAHYDLWQDNFLWAPDDNEFGFVVIDWGGARAGGHAIYDLLRLALSSPTNIDGTLAELRAHCRILECPPEHAAGHALAALGHLAMNLNDWPVERLTMTAGLCVDLVNALEQRFHARPRVPAQIARTHEWGLADATASALQQLDLADYDALMHANISASFKTKPGLAVHRLRHPHSGEPLFLKRCTEAPDEPLWRLAARRWLRRRPLHSEPFHVHMASRTLRAHGFNAMPVLAWGERRTLGWLPDQGFMLACSMPGDSLADVFAAATTTVRQRVLAVVGRLMGRLHQRGFAVTLRLHDLLASAQDFEAPAWRAVDPAMIDLDFKGQVLNATGFDLERAIRASAHSAYLLLRTGQRLAHGEAGAWWRAYRQQLRSAGIVLPRRLSARLRQQVQIELAQHHGDARLVALFPQTPLPLGR